MYHPTRGGTRGGQADFKWTDVKQDKDRENYLGHSINAPQGRWQNNQDIHWYSRDKADDANSAPSLEQARTARQEELRKIKEQEEDALAVALGFQPAVRDGDGAGTGANSVVVPKSEKQLEVERLEKEERKRAKELKRQQKEVRQLEKEFNKEYKAHKKAERRAAAAGTDRGHEQGHEPRRDRDRDWDQERRRTPGSRSPAYRERASSRGEQRGRSDRGRDRGDRHHDREERHGGGGRGGEGEGRSDRRRDESSTHHRSPDEREHLHRSAHHRRLGSEWVETLNDRAPQKGTRERQDDSRAIRASREVAGNGRSEHREMSPERRRERSRERTRNSRNDAPDALVDAAPDEQAKREKIGHGRHGADTGLTIKDEDE